MFQNFIKFFGNKHEFEKNILFNVFENSNHILKLLNMYKNGFWCLQKYRRNKIFVSKMETAY